MISIYGEQGVESRFLNALTYSGNNYYAMAVFLLAAYLCIYRLFLYLFQTETGLLSQSAGKKGELAGFENRFKLFDLCAASGNGCAGRTFYGSVLSCDRSAFCRSCSGEVFLYLLVFLSSYFLCLLAMLMTGKLSTGILLTPVLFGFPGVVSWLYRLFQKTFYTGYLESESNNLFRKYPSPGTCMLDLTERWNRYVENGLSGKMSWREPILLILFLLLEIMLCVCLYRNRRTETAGNAVVFPKLGILISFWQCVRHPWEWGSA